MLGKIHSIETLGLNDGPGVRFVAFLQGCSLRCAYCHNPDTWKLEGGVGMGAEDLVARALRYKSYFDRSGGGITFSGGEPLLQPDFLVEALRLSKEAGLHTVLDTAGFGIGRTEEILSLTDLVLLDIKHVDHRGYRQLAGGDMDRFHRFVRAVKESGKKVWIRHVVVPGMTEGAAHFRKLEGLIRSLPQVEKVELLPYHVLGVHKYEAMGMAYPLRGVAPMDPEKVRFWEKDLNDRLEDRTDSVR